MFNHIGPLVAILFFASSGAAMAQAAAQAQAYPSKLIRILAAAPGGGGDLSARVIAQELRRTLGQAVVVENRTGILSVSAVASAPADGYTLLSAASSLWIGPLFNEMPYDPIKDFAPISLVITTPTVLVVHPSLPVKTVKDLIALAKSKPGVLNYGSGAIGSSNHLAAELFNQMAGVRIVNILYKGTSAALTDVIGGRLEIMFAPAEVAAQQVKTGKLKALAVTSPRPSKLAPGLPTMAASGLPGFEAEAFYGLLAPEATDSAIVSRLNREVVQALSRPDVKEKLTNGGFEILGNKPEEFAGVMKADVARWKKVADRLKLAK